MPLRSVLGATILALGLAQTAFGWGPDDDGVYGTLEGCHFAETGNITSDDIFVLRPNDLEFYAAFCAFALVSPETQFGHAVVAICRDEGEIEHRINHFQIVRNADRADAYDVFDGEGAKWATADRC